MKKRSTDISQVTKDKSGPHARESIHLTRRSDQVHPHQPVPCITTRSNQTRLIPHDLSISRLEVEESGGGIGGGSSGTGCERDRQGRCSCRVNEEGEGEEGEREHVGTGGRASDPRG